MEASIQTHNQRPAAVWSSGGADYDRISRGIADSIEHCVMRLDPQPGERIRELLGKDFDLKFEKGVSCYREPSAEAAWTTFSTGYGPTKALAAGLDEARRADLQRDFIAFHAGFPTELGICVPREYWLTVGVRK